MSCEGRRKEHLGARRRRKTGRIFGSVFIGQRENLRAAEDGGFASHVQFGDSHLHLIKTLGRRDVMRRFGGRGASSSSHGGL